MKIPVMRQVTAQNDAVAGELRERFDRLGLFVVNIMGSPGSGKTSLIEQTVLRARMKVGAIEGDLATSLDAERAAQAGARAVQINTGAGCHLDSTMVRKALEELRLDDLGLLMIENVGNLVCPVQFYLGEDARVIVASTPEGDDKVLKYPAAFSLASAVVLNKADLLGHLRFDSVKFQKHLSGLNSGAPLFTLSCSSGEGIDRWMEWLEEAVRSPRK